MTLSKQAVVLIMFAMPSAGLAQSPPVLSLPIDCRPGEDCAIQNYVDHDPSPASRDYKCGTRTYNAHNGVDFRLPNELVRKKGVSVLAASSGVVDRLRDGEPDISVRATGQAAVANKECGNGVVINHDGGWSTQYCHMAKGSIAVKAGQKVAAGDRIGLVGLSGNTEYPHMHLSVRHNGELIDPFSYGTSSTCGGDGKWLWGPEVHSLLRYRDLEVLNKGFTSLPVTMESIESGEVLSHPLSKEGPLVAYVRVIGLKAGDVQSISITTPSGSPFATQAFPPSDANKAQAFVSVGRRNPTLDWPSGEYRATFTVQRGGQEIYQTSFSATR